MIPFFNRALRILKYSGFIETSPAKVGMLSPSEETLSGKLLFCLHEAQSILFAGIATFLEVKPRRFAVSANADFVESVSPGLLTGMLKSGSPGITLDCRIRVRHTAKCIYQGAALGPSSAITVASGAILLSFRADSEIVTKAHLGQCARSKSATSCTVSLGSV